MLRLSIGRKQWAENIRCHCMITAQHCSTLLMCLIRWAHQYDKQWFYLLYLKSLYPFHCVCVHVFRVLAVRNVLMSVASVTLISTCAIMMKPWVHLAQQSGTTRLIKPTSCLNRKQRAEKTHSEDASPKITQRGLKWTLRLRLGSVSCGLGGMTLSRTLH